MSGGLLLSSALIGGVVNGALYGLLGLAIVMIFRTTAVANFAQGDFGMFAAFMLLMGLVPMGLPLWMAWAATVLGSAVGAAVIYVVLLRPRPDAGHLNGTIRTLGVSMLIYAVALYAWGAGEPYRVPSLFASTTYTVGGFALSLDQLGTVVVAIALSVALLLFFRYTRVGLAMRAVAISPEIAQLQGIPVRRIVFIVWAVAGAIGAVVGLLIAPISFLDTGLMRPYLLKAFTAAILGGLNSFPGVLIGGVILGVAEALAALVISIHFREVFVFVVLLGVLLVSPAGLFGKVVRTRV